MADVALLPADPAAAFKRAQQGKSYWRRVWKRLRDDKVTLAVIGVLVMLLIMVVFSCLRPGSPCMTPTRARCCDG